MNRNFNIRQQRPFGAVPDTRFYFSHSSIQSAFDTIVRAMKRAEGPVAVLGGAGFGKSLLVELVSESLCERMDVVKLQSARICSRQALLQNILYELQLPYRGLSEGELRLSILDRLEPSPETAPDGILIVVDEAQTLHPKLLDELRLLTNFSRNSQLRVRLLLVGNMRLEELLANPQLVSLNQRLAARCYLQPMNGEETSEYVRHQMRMSGRNPDTCISPDALRAVFSASDGIPRLVNQIMDHAMVLAASQARELITSDLVSESWAELQQLPAPWSQGKADSMVAPIGNPIEFGLLDDPNQSAEFCPESLPHELHQSLPIEHPIESRDVSSSCDSSHLYCSPESDQPQNFFAAFSMVECSDFQVLPELAELEESVEHGVQAVNPDELDNSSENMEIWEDDPPLQCTKNFVNDLESQRDTSSESTLESRQYSDDEERTQELFGDDFDLELVVPNQGHVPREIQSNFAEPSMAQNDQSKQQHQDYLARLQETADTLTEVTQFSDAAPSADTPLPWPNSDSAQPTSSQLAIADPTRNDPQWSINVGVAPGATTVEDSIEDIISQLNFSAFMVEPFSVEQIPLYPTSSRHSDSQSFAAEIPSTGGGEPQEGVRVNSQQQVLMLHRPLDEGQLFTGVEEFDDDRDLLIIEERLAPNSQLLYQNLPSEPAQKPSPYNQLFSRLRK